MRAPASPSSFMEGQLEELRSMMEGSGAALVPFVRELKVVNPEEKSISSPPSYCNRASNTPMLKRSESNREQHSRRSKAVRSKPLRYLRRVRC